MVAFCALASWRWRARHQIDWSDVIAWALLLRGLAVVCWILSSWALDVYQRLYEIAPAQPADDPERTKRYREMLYNATHDYGGFALGFGVVAATFLVACIVKIWNAFNLQELAAEIAVYEEHLRHDHPDTTD
jgi:hypothetical protein